MICHKPGDQEVLANVGASGVCERIPDVRRQGHRSDSTSEQKRAPAGRLWARD